MIKDFITKLKHRITTKYVQFCRKIILKYDGSMDKKICGCLLTEYVPSKYRETLGSTGSQSTNYWVLDEFFKNADFSEKDSFVDIGCGKGRVLAYLTSIGFKGKLTGIELDEDVANYCKNWADKYENITVINGNAFDYDYNEYTVLCICRPFLPDTFKKFLQKIETELEHPVKFYYQWEGETGYLLNNRPGWKLIRRESYLNKYGLRLYYSRQSFSVWEYTPVNNK